MFRDRHPQRIAVVFLLGLGLASCAQSNDSTAPEPTSAAATSALVDGCTQLSEALLTHACIHARFGPFETIFAQSDAGFAGDAPNVDAPHRHFEIELNDGPGGHHGVVKYTPLRGGEWAVTLEEAVALRVLAPDGTELTSVLDQATSTCDEVGAAQVFDLQGGVTYRLAFGPTPAHHVGVVIEKASDFTRFFWTDGDADGFGAPDGASIVTACADPPGFAPSDDDCNDADAAVNPGQSEQCDGEDDNCDGRVDEGVANVCGSCDGATILGAAIVEHSCLHAEFGPFDPVTAQADPDAPGLVGVNTPHTLYQVSLAAVTGGQGGAVSYTPTRSGAWVVSTGQAVSLEVLDDHGHVIPSELEQALPGCADLETGRAYDFEAGETYRLVFGPTTDTQVDVILEKLSDFAAFYYADGDSDGFGDADSTLLTGCVPPAGFVTDDTDCNDGEASVHPGNAEICDGLDNDCNGSIDEGVRNACGTCSALSELNAALQETACVRGAFGPNRDVTASADPSFAGADPQINQASTFHRVTLPAAGSDFAGTVKYTPARSGDWAVFAGQDQAFELLTDAGEALEVRLDHAVTSCAEIASVKVYALDAGITYRLSVGPGAQSQVGFALEKLSDHGSFFFADADGDGAGDPSDFFVSACVDLPAGFVDNDTDCNDADASAHPGGIEVCDGQDNDCNAQIDEAGGVAWFQDGDNDGFGHSVDPFVGCVPPAGYVALSSDCDDSNPDVNPGAEDIQNGIDDNCDGAIDEDLPDAVGDFIADHCDIGSAGPFVDVDAAAPGTPGPDVSTPDTAYHVALVEVDDGQGGTDYAGELVFEADEDAEVGFLLDAAIPLSIFDASGAEVELETSYDDLSCAALPSLRIYDFEAGAHRIVLGPTDNDEVLIIAGELGEHGHGHGDEDGIDAALEEACFHAENGPFEVIDASALGTGSGPELSRHTESMIHLPDAGGGEFGGEVEVHITEDGEYAFIFDINLPFEVRDDHGHALEVETTLTGGTECALKPELRLFDLEPGHYLVVIGPSAHEEVAVVFEEVHSDDDGHGHGDEEGIDAALEEACFHAENGPFEVIDASALGTGSGPELSRHTESMIHLPDAGGGEFGGEVEVHVTEDGEYAFIFDINLPFEVRDDHGHALEVETTLTGGTECDLKPELRLFDLEPGHYLVVIGPSEHDEVAVVFEEVHSDDDGHGHGDEEGIDAALEEACFHAENGPFEVIDASALGTGSGPELSRHTESMIHLPDAGGGEFGGEVEVHVTEDGEYAFIFDINLPFEVRDDHGHALEVETTLTGGTECALKPELRLFDLAPGHYLVVIGPSAHDEVAVVFEEVHSDDDGHGHGDDEGVVITGTPARFVQPGVFYTADLDSELEDDPDCTWELHEGPAGMSVSPTTGIVEWLPAAADLGTQPEVEVELLCPADGLEGHFAWTIHVLGNVQTIDPATECPADALRNADVREGAAIIIGCGDVDPARCGFDLDIRRGGFAAGRELHLAGAPCADGHKPSLRGRVNIGASHVVLSDLDLSDMTWGLVVAAGAVELENVSILRNDIHDCRGHYQPAVHLSRVDDVLVANNRIWGCSYGVGFMNRASNVAVYHNTVTSVPGGRALEASIFFDAHARLGSPGLDLRNNILGAGRVWVLFNAWGQPADLISDHNLFVEQGAISALPAAGTLAAWQTGTGLDTHSAAVDGASLLSDLFESLDPADDDFLRLHEDAPALGIGEALSSVTTDFEGEERSDTAPDAGADEF